MAVTVTIKTPSLTLEKSSDRGFDEATRIARALVELIHTLDRMGISSQGDGFRDLLLSYLIGNRRSIAKPRPETGAALEVVSEDGGGMEGPLGQGPVQRRLPAVLARYPDGVGVVTLCQAMGCSRSAVILALQVGMKANRIVRIGHGRYQLCQPVEEPAA